MSEHHHLFADVFQYPFDSPAYLPGHLRQRDRGQGGEAERNEGRARPHHGFGAVGAAAARLAPPGAAVHEDEGLLPLAVDIERFLLRRAVSLAAGFADFLAHFIAGRGEARDQDVGIRHPGALLVLPVELGLRVVAEDLAQNRMAMPSSSPSEFASSTRLCAMRKPSPARRTWCSTRAPQVLCFSERNSMRISVEFTFSKFFSSATAIFPT